MDIIIYKNENGGLSTISPSGSIEACIKDIPEGAEYSIVDDSEVVILGIFDGSRSYVGGKVVIDFEKAKEIAHEKRRDARDKELYELDREWTYQPEIAEPKRVLVRGKYEVMQVDIEESGEDIGLLTSAIEGVL